MVDFTIVFKNYLRNCHNAISTLKNIDTMISVRIKSWRIAVNSSTLMLRDDDDAEDTDGWVAAREYVV